MDMCSCPEQGSRVGSRAASSDTVLAFAGHSEQRTDAAAKIRPGRAPCTAGCLQPSAPLISLFSAAICSLQSARPACAPSSVCAALRATEHLPPEDVDNVAC
jgi:hypothetical protein